LGVQVTAPTPNLSNAAKYTALLAGGGVGVGGGFLAHSLLPSPDRERELSDEGVDVISHREATATFAPMAFVAAAAIGAGIGKRSDTAAITTASLGAAAMLASTGASTMINAESENAGDYLRTLGLMTGVAAGAFAIGAMDEVPLHRAKLAGLVAIGLAGGAMLPETLSYVAELPGDLARSTEYAD
jgi:hypothetical protein